MHRRLPSGGTMGGGCPPSFWFGSQCSSHWSRTTFGWYRVPLPSFWFGSQCSSHWTRTTRRGCRTAASSAPTTSSSRSGSNSTKARLFAGKKEKKEGKKARKSGAHSLAPLRCGLCGSTRSQHTVTAHGHSTCSDNTQSQHTVTAQAVTAHGYKHTNGHSKASLRRVRLRCG